MKKDFLKFPLRKALFSTVILFSLSAIFSSCGDDVEGRISGESYKCENRSRPR